MRRARHAPLPVLLGVLLVALAWGPAAARETAPERAVVPAETRADFCRRLQAIIAAERAREAREFAPSLVEAVAAVRAAKARGVVSPADDGDEVEIGPAPLTRADAVDVARLLWARWLPTDPAASVTVVSEGDGGWLLAPAAGAGPEYPGDPIRIDKASGNITWKLPHPSERERLHRAMCSPEQDGR